MIGRKDVDRELTPDVRLLVRSLSNTLRGLEIANSDPALCLAYQKLLDFLTGNDSKLVEAVFGELKKKKYDGHASSSNVSSDEIAKLSIEDLEKILIANVVSKADLAQIAIVRFSVTKGTISKLSREALRLKLANLIENEKTHQTIGRVASSSD